MFNSRHISTQIDGSGLLHQLTDEERLVLRRCLIGIYKDFSDICEKHSLCYMLGGGSALGAVRHKGFIPWDDDLDVMMPREDYDRFIEVFNEELSDGYHLYVPNSGHDISNTFAKLVKKNTRIVDIYNVRAPFYKGIWLDIFPIENVPVKRIARAIKGFLSDLMAFVVVSRYIYTYRNPMLKDYFCSHRMGRIYYKVRLLTGFLSGIMDYKKWYNKYDSFVRHERSSDLCTIPTGRRHYRGEILERSIFVPTRKGEFEGMSVNLPNDVDAYLRNLYGDYMEIPPVEKRERHLFVDFGGDNYK